MHLETLVRRPGSYRAAIRCLSIRRSVTFAFVVREWFRRRREAKSQRQYELQPALAFLFQQPRYELRCTDRRPGERQIYSRPTLVVSSSNQAPYLITRMDDLQLPRAEVP